MCQEAAGGSQGSFPVIPISGTQEQAVARDGELLAVRLVSPLPLWRGGGFVTETSLPVAAVWLSWPGWD